MNWHYSKDGKQHGPVGADELRSLLASGQVMGTDLAWRDGMVDWTPIAKIAELQGSSLGAGNYTTSYQNPGAALQPRMTAAGRTSGLAIASLVCGCIGMLGFAACIIPCVAALPGIICGHMAMGQIRRSQGQVQGRGLAIGGLVTSYLTIVILVVMLIGFVMMGLVVSPVKQSTTIEAIEQPSDELQAPPVIEEENLPPSAPENQEQQPAESSQES